MMSCPAAVLGLVFGCLSYADVIWDDGALVADLVRLEQERGFRMDM